MEGLEELGYLGLFISSFLSATLIPLSPEILLGILIFKGFKLWLSILVATLGNFFGGITTYFVGYLGDWKKIEKYFKIRKEKVYSFKKRIDKLGSFIAFFSWMPILGDILTLSLGFFRVNIKGVFVWMFIGRSLRFIVIAYLIYNGIKIVI